MFKYITAIIACCHFPSFSMDIAPNKNEHIIAIAKNTYNLTTDQWNNAIKNFNKKFGYPHIDVVIEASKNLSYQDRHFFDRYIHSSPDCEDTRLIKLARRTEMYYELQFDDREWRTTVQQFNIIVGIPSHQAKIEALGFLTTEEKSLFIKHIISKKEIFRELKDAQAIRIKFKNNENHNPNIKQECDCICKDERSKRWCEQRKKIPKK